mmetsp:Transcript_46690/g.107947  ORF Transcript_46690/g.107947 Transcript_46690/m.107947 type:complete len:106 (-) Transcript_46690:972-1289(-)
MEHLKLGLSGLASEAALRLKFLEAPDGELLWPQTLRCRPLSAAEAAVLRFEHLGVVSNAQARVWGSLAKSDARAATETTDGKYSVRLLALPTADGHEAAPFDEPH